MSDERAVDARKKFDLKRFAIFATCCAIFAWSPSAIKSSGLPLFVQFAISIPLLWLLFQLPALACTAFGAVPPGELTSDHDADTRTKTRWTVCMTWMFIGLTGMIQSVIEQGALNFLQSTLVFVIPFLFFLVAFKILSEKWHQPLALGIAAVAWCLIVSILILHGIGKLP